MNQADQAIHIQSNELTNVIRLRAAVGLLGDKEHENWWPSLWFASNATGFLSPIYGERTGVARYQGMVQTARFVHDNRIGVGRAFHLFRLPENLERRLHDAIIRDNAIGTAGGIPSKANAEALLEEIAEPVDANAGPIRVGNATDFERPTWTQFLAGHYLAAFKNSQQTFPYFVEN
ncbi:MAG: BrxE family protein [Paracoccaceae bacterium]